MKKVVIIDHGMGNINSVARAIEECGHTPLITNNPCDLKFATHIVLPGVGAFADAIEWIRENHFDAALEEEVLEKEIPFLGICLGMQLIATKGSEGGESEGLGWIEGEVKRFNAGQSYERIPHVGWNSVHLKKASPLFKDIPCDKDFYFVHSYHFVSKDEDAVIALTPYCGNFVSAIGKKNIYGIQFHPEKSQRFGLKLIGNFLSF